MAGGGEGKKDKVEEKKGSGRKVGIGVAGNKAQELLSHRARLGGDIGGTESSLDASDGGTCEFSTSRASVSQHPHGFWCWAQITEEGVRGEKSLEP